MLVILKGGSRRGLEAFVRASWSRPIMADAAASTSTASEPHAMLTDGDFSFECEAPLIKWDPEAPLPAFHNWHEVFPFLARVPSFRKALLEEVRSSTVPAEWTEWPETTLYKGGPDDGESSSDWRVVPLVYTFPANDPTQTTWVDAECARLPLAAKLLRSIPGVRTALFSRLGPGTTLTAHRGWASLANHVLRCHLALAVPGEDQCGVVVDGEVRYHREGEIIVFDDSKEHYAFNHHPTGSRIVLIFDLARPEGLAEGEAERGATAELTAFIEAFASGRR